jgi:hypothetical protein
VAANFTALEMHFVHAIHNTKIPLPALPTHSSSPSREPVAVRRIKGVFGQEVVVVR